MRHREPEEVKFRRSPPERIPYQSRESQTVVTRHYAPDSSFFAMKRDRSSRLRWWWSGPFKRWSLAVAAASVGALLLWAGVTGLRQG